MTHLVLSLHVLSATVRLAAGRVGERRRAATGDAGLSTLEVVVLALGLFLVAGVLVAAITTAVNSRLSQIQ